MSAPRYDQDLEAPRWFDPDRVPAAWFDKDLAGGVPARTLQSTAALPLGGMVALTNAIVLASARALPLGAVSDLDNPIAFEEGPPERLPLGGSIDLDIPVALAQSAALPLGGTIDMSSSAAATDPLVLAPRRRVPQPMPIPKPRRPARKLGSYTRLPLAGETTFALGDPDGVTDDMLMDLLTELVS